MKGLSEQVTKFIKEAIQLEVDGQEFFNHAAEITHNELGKKMFLRLAQEEVKHLEAFSKLFSSIVKTDEWKKYVKREESKPRSQVIEELASRLKKAEGKSEIEALSMGMELEQRAINFFSNTARDMSDYRAKEIFERICDEERFHYDLLQAQHDSLTHSGFWLDSAEFQMNGENSREAKNQMASEKSQKGKIFILILLVLLFLLGSFSYSSTPSAEEAKKEKSREKKFGYIVLPVLYYTPETKMAAGVGTLFYFRSSTEPKSRPSDIRTVIIYTQRKQFIFETNHDFYLKKESYHLTINAGFSKFPDKFFGVGNQTAEEMEEDYTSRITRFNVSLQKRVFQRMYVGLKYGFEHHKIVEVEKDRLLARKELLGSEGGTSAGIGLQLNWDSRNSVYYPTSGSLHKFSLTLFQSFLGSDYTFTEFSLDLRKYIPLFSSHVLALEGYCNLISGHPPFQMMSLFGGQEMMRGYYQGRYRDKQMMAFQMEYRLPAFWRIGLVAFAGWGDVADKISHFALRNFKYSLGWGIRFALNREESINLRLDFGYGKHSSGIYFTAGEAF